MDKDVTAFRSAAERLTTSDGANLADAVSEGRHALVLLRHFG